MKTMTPEEIRLRLLLTVSVAGLGFLATNDTWIGLVGKIGVMLTGFVLVVFQAWRGFIDKSASSGAEPPVIAETAPDKPLETVDADSAAPESKPAAYAPGMPEGEPTEP